MPDESDPSPPRRDSRHRPRHRELSRESTEEDLWDLDEDLPAPRAEEAVPRETPASQKHGTDKSQPSVTRLELGRRAPKEEPEPETEEAPPEAERDETAAEPEPETSSSEAETSTEPAAAPETEIPDPEPIPSEPLAPEPASERWKKLSGAERIGLIAVAVAFLGLTLWAVFSLATGIETTRLGADEPDYPIEGRHATVAKARTFWREPNREGENPDVARPGVEFIPVVEITLHSGDSGVLRAIFRDNRNEYVGDAISRSFRDGKFTGSGSPTVEFPATDGFQLRGDYSAYRVGESRWSVEIFEGPSLNAPGKEFKPLFTAPISTERH